MGCRATLAVFFARLSGVHIMNDLFTPLSDKELDQLEVLLLNRIDDETDTLGKDEGIFELSSLDGFLTAVVSGPVVMAPSQWLASIWGDFEPKWQNEKDFEIMFTLLMRHMNSIAEHLMNEPDSFQPLFMQREVDGRIYTIVDDWCYGYMMGVELCVDKWGIDSMDMVILLTPIRIFGTEAGWKKLDELNEQETDNIRLAITPNVREIHAYWLARRDQNMRINTPVQRSEPRVGRNDPCPCGSGKKYKKCCLH